MFGKEIIKVVDETKIRELERQLKEQREDFDSRSRIKDNELKIRVDEAVKAEKQANSELKERNAVLTKEVEILTKAFENMGFDVKDMKEILNKLVDGLVSKNQVNVIK